MQQNIFIRDCGSVEGKTDKQFQQEQASPSTPPLASPSTPPMADQTAISSSAPNTNTWKFVKWSVNNKLVSCLRFLYLKLA